MGARWQDLPIGIPTPTTCWRRLRDWSQSGLFADVWTSPLEVVVDINEESREIELILQWQGCVHTEMRLPHRGRGAATRTPTDIIQAVRILAKVVTDETIAGFLNRI